MANLYGEGKDPQTGTSLGRPYPRHTPSAERIAKQVAALPADLADEAREAAVATITCVELAKRTATAVAGFDLTFTATKSVSTLWAVADDDTRAALLAAHRAAVGQTPASGAGRDDAIRTGPVGGARPRRPADRPTARRPTRCRGLRSVRSGLCPLLVV